MSGVAIPAPPKASHTASARRSPLGVRTRPLPHATLRALLSAVAVLALGLLALRVLSERFPPGTTTADHPVFAVLAALVLSGTAWMALFPLIRRITLAGAPTRKLVLAGLGLAVLLRALFFGSHAIYEDDFRRYLWDGAVVTQGLDPYAHSPAEVAAPPAATDSAQLARLKDMARESGNFPATVNNPALTTIYPPAAQVPFAAAALIAPLDPDALRLVFLLVELATFALMVASLRHYGRDPLWVLLYALCPLVIFAGFNTLHMDLLLAPALVGALLWVRRRPLLAALALGLASAVKVWPLVLGPVLFRRYRRQPLRYFGYGALLGALTLALLWPMLAHSIGQGSNSGLAAYSAGWVRSSFLFPLISDALTPLADDPGRLARLCVAAAVTLSALGFAFLAKPDPRTLSLALLAVTLVLLFLSPTGYPWYAIWVAVFLPFAPSRGAALLCVCVSLYYLRFWLGETGRYSLYLDVLVPIQFAPPLLVLAFEAYRGRPLHD